MGVSVLARKGRANKSTSEILCRDKGKYVLIHPYDGSEDRGQLASEHGKYGEPARAQHPAGMEPRRRLGRKRKARYMGRETFLSRSRDYLADIKPFIAPSTWSEKERKLRYISRVTESHYCQGRLSSEDPSKFTERDIGCFLEWMRREEFEPSYQAKLFEHISGLLSYLGNPVLQKLRASKIARLPRRNERSIYVKNDAWFSEVMLKLDGIDGWRGEVVRFALAFYFHTGSRVKELRLSALEDVDITKWTFTIAHPKGEYVWASAGERVAIFPSLRPYVLDFLDARARRCQDLGLEPERVEPLIPNGFGDFYSEAGWRSLKVKVFREAGIEPLGYRVLRQSFAQKLKDRAVPIEAVSKALRHSSTATTERFYARIKTEDAWNILQKAWESPVVVATPETKS